MPSQTHRIPNHLRTGQVSEALAVRTDWENRQDALLKARNVTVKQQGGVRKRPGLRFVANVGNQFKRLYAWFRRTDESYLVAQSDTGEFRVLNADPALGVNQAATVTGTLREGQQDFVDRTRQFSADAVSVFVDGGRPYTVEIQSTDDVRVRENVILGKDFPATTPNRNQTDTLLNYGTNFTIAEPLYSPPDDQPISFEDNTLTRSTDGSAVMEINTLRSYINVARENPTSNNYGYNTNYGSITNERRSYGGNINIDTRAVYVTKRPSGTGRMTVQFSRSLLRGVEEVAVKWGSRTKSFRIAHSTSSTRTTGQENTTNPGVPTYNPNNTDLTTQEMAEWEALTTATGNNRAYLEFVPVFSSSSITNISNSLLGRVGPENGRQNITVPGTSFTDVGQFNGSFTAFENFDGTTLFSPSSVGNTEPFYFSSVNKFGETVRQGFSRSIVLSLKTYPSGSGIRINTNARINPQSAGTTDNLKFTVWCRRVGQTEDSDWKEMTFIDGDGGRRGGRWRFYPAADIGGYTEIGRWNDSGSDYRTSGEANYTNFNGVNWCANRSTANSAAPPFPLNTTDTYRLRYVPGGSATQPAAEVIGTATQGHIDGGIACYRFGSAEDMTAAFGQPESNPNSPSRFHGGTWILQRQIPAGEGDNGTIAPEDANYNPAWGTEWAKWTTTTNEGQMENVGLEFQLRPRIGQFEEFYGSKRFMEVGTFADDGFVINGIFLVYNNQLQLGTSNNTIPTNKNIVVNFGPGGLTEKSFGFRSNGLTTLNQNQINAFRGSAPNAIGQGTYAMSFVTRDGNESPEILDGKIFGVGAVVGGTTTNPTYQTVFIKGREVYGRNVNAADGLRRFPVAQNRRFTSVYINDIIGTNPTYYMDIYEREVLPLLRANPKTNTATELQKVFSEVGTFITRPVAFTNPPATYYDSSNTDAVAAFNAEKARVGDRFTVSLPDNHVDYYGPATDALPVPLIVDRNGDDAYGEEGENFYLTKDRTTKPTFVGKNLTQTGDADIAWILSNFTADSTPNRSQVLTRLNTEAKLDDEIQKQQYRYRSAPATSADLFRFPGNYVMNWNDVDGFPIAVGAWDTRLVFGGTRRFPNSFWASVENKGFEFLARAKNEVLSNAREAQSIIDTNFSFQYSLDKADTIQNIYASNSLIIFSENSENILSGRMNAADLTWIRSQSSSTLGSRGTTGLAEIDKQIFIHNGEEATALQYISDQEGYRNLNISGQFNEDIFLGDIDTTTGQRETRQVIRIAGGLIRNARGAYQVLYLNEDGKILVWHTLQDAGFFAWAEWDFFEDINKESDGTPILPRLPGGEENPNYRKIIDIVYHASSRRIFLLDSDGNIYTLQEDQTFDDNGTLEITLTDGTKVNQQVLVNRRTSSPIPIEVKTVPYAAFEVPGEGLHWIKRIKNVSVDYSSLSSDNDTRPVTAGLERERPGYVGGTVSVGFSAIDLSSAQAQLIREDEIKQHFETEPEKPLPERLTTIETRQVDYVQEVPLSVSSLLPGDEGTPTPVRTQDRFIPAAYAVSRGVRFFHVEAAAIDNQDYVYGVVVLVSHKGEGPFELNRIDATVEFEAKG